MSVAILASSLTAKDKQQIVDDLHLVAKDKMAHIHKADKKHFYADSAEAKSINFFSMRRVVNSKSTIAGRSSSSSNNSSNKNTGEDILLLPFYYVCEKFGLSKPNDQLVKKKLPGFKMNEDFALKDYQKEAVRYAFEDFEKFGTAFFNVFCAFGKTVVAVFISYIFGQKMGCQTLVLVPENPLVSSWYQTYLEFTDAKVYVVGSTKNKCNIYDANILICPCHQIDKLSKDQLGDIGFLIIDEADSYCTPGHVASLLATQPYRVLALTATYERDDGMESILDLVVGPSRIVKISSRPFFVLKYSTPFEPLNVERNKMGISYSDLIHKVSFIPQRFNFLINLIYNNLDRKILVMVLHVDYLTMLYQALQRLFEDTKTNKTVSTYYSSMTSYDDADVLIGTYKKLGRGFDQKAKCRNGWDGRRFNFVIQGASIMKIEQPCGRGNRCEDDVPPVHIEFVDKHTNFKKHWGVRYPWYLSRNGIVKEVKTMIKYSELVQTPEYQRELAMAKARQANDSVCPNRITKPSCLPRINTELEQAESRKHNSKFNNTISDDDVLEYLEEEQALVDDDESVAAASVSNDTGDNDTLASD